MSWLWRMTLREARRLIARVVILIVSAIAVTLLVRAIPIDPEIRIHKGPATLADRELGHILLDGQEWFWTVVYITKARPESEPVERCQSSSNAVPAPAKQCQPLNPQPSPGSSEREPPAPGLSENSPTIE
jgi:hypothetical protein